MKKDPRKARASDIRAARAMMNDDSGFLVPWKNVLKAYVEFRGASNGSFIYDSTHPEIRRAKKSKKGKK